MDKKELARHKFLNGYNCAQAVLCTYAQDLGMDEETAYRLAEGFGSGIPGLQSLCGACSAMIMVESLKNCAKKDLEKPTRPATYAKIREVTKEFEKEWVQQNVEYYLKQKTIQ